MSDTEQDDYHSDDQGGYVDFWDAMQYSTDQKGKKNYLKIGRAWAKEDSNVITLNLYAAPFPNQPGKAVLKLIPYYPESKNKAK